MKIWKVEQRYYDNGKIEVSLSSVEAETILRDEHQGHSNHDYWCDYFVEQDVAEGFVKECENA